MLQSIKSPNQPLLACRPKFQAEFIGLYDLRRAQALVAKSWREHLLHNLELYCIREKRIEGFSYTCNMGLRDPCQVGIGNKHQPTTTILL